MWVVCVHCNVTKREFMAHATKYDRKIAVKCIGFEIAQETSSVSDMCVFRLLCFFSLVNFFQIKCHKNTNNNKNARKVSHLWETIIGRIVAVAVFYIYLFNILLRFFLVAPKEWIYIGIFGRSWRKTTESVRWTGRSDLNKKHIFYVETRLLFSA